MQTGKRKSVDCDDDANTSSSAKKPRMCVHERISVLEGLAALEGGSCHFRLWSGPYPKDSLIDAVLEAAETKHNRKDWACLLGRRGFDGDFTDFTRRSTSSETWSLLSDDARTNLCNMYSGIITYDEYESLVRILAPIAEQGDNQTRLVVIAILSAFARDPFGSCKVARAGLVFEQTLTRAIALFVHSRFREFGAAGFSAAISSLDRFAHLWNIAIDPVDAWKIVHQLSGDEGKFDARHYSRLASLTSLADLTSKEVMVVVAAEKSFRDIFRVVTFGLDLVHYIADPKSLISIVSRDVVAEYSK